MSDADAALEQAAELLRAGSETAMAEGEALLRRLVDEPGTRARALSVLGGHLFYRGMYDEVLDIGESLLAGPLAEAGAGWNLKGLVWLEQARWTDAYDAFVKASQLLPPSHRLAGSVVNNLGLVCWRLGEHDAALRYFEAAMRRFQEADDRGRAGTACNNMGLVEEERGEPARAEVLYRRAITLLEGHPGYLANAQANLAELHENRGELEPAERLQLEALAIRERLGQKRGIAGSCLCMARLCLATARLGEAETYLERGEALANDLDLQKHQADALEIRSDLLAARGAHEEALTALREAWRRRTELDAASVRRRIEAAHARGLLEEARSVAARRAVEARELREARDRAERALRARSVFMAAANHELRNPLAIALGACELLLDADNLGPHDQSLLTTMRQALETIRHLVDDVLELERVGLGAMSVSPEPVDPRDLVSRSAELIRALGNPRIDVVTDVDETVPETLQLDPRRVQQVLLNLLSNGVKYTRAGTVRLRVWASDQTLSFAVTDSGIGIPESFVPQLFEPFAREGSIRVRGIDGTGLGLPIARRIAERLGGSLHLQRTSELGSTFVLRVPLVT